MSAAQWRRVLGVIIGLAWLVAAIIFALSDAFDTAARDALVAASAAAGVAWLLLTVLE